MNSKSTAASIWRSRWSFGTSSSSVTISSSCCVGMGVFSITPLKNNPPPPTHTHTWRGFVSNLTPAHGRRVEGDDFGLATLLPDA
ncbi:hypothetical protein DM77_380 [Burkholderia mallei]|nr:hypothetical protein DM77_380 [Burkholderia mallei]